MTAMRDRMDGDYEAPILRGPDEDRPVPAWTGEDVSPATDPQRVSDPETGDR